MSFYTNKPKKRGCGLPRKVQAVPPLPPPPQPCAKKKKVEETKTGSRKYANYSDPAVAAARQEAVEFYISNGKFQTHGDALLTNQPIIHIPKRMIVRDAVKILGSNNQANNKSPPARLSLLLDSPATVPVSTRVLTGRVARLSSILGSKGGSKGCCKGEEGTGKKIEGRKES